MATWNASFHADPAVSDKASEGYANINETRVEVEARIKNEHGTYSNTSVGADGTATKDWFHKMGSGVAYYQADAPTQRPDAATSLGTNDAGRLWVDSDDGSLDYWDGSAWTNLFIPSIYGGSASFPIVRLKVLEIGDWNMDTTAVITIDHGLDYTKIINVSLSIRGDSGTAYPLAGLSGGGSFGVGCIWYIVPAPYTDKIYLNRATGGAFDSTAYNSTSFNRGWIFIWYVD